jgi:hypothetical protein
VVEGAYDLSWTRNHKNVEEDDHSSGCVDHHMNGPFGVSAQGECSCCCC